MVDLPVWATLLILAAVAGLSFIVGHWLARSWRMDDYGMRLSIVIGSVSFAVAVCILLWPPKLGIDLSGGVILVYEIDEAATQRQQDLQQGPVQRAQPSDLVNAILIRLNPSGLADVVVRPYGDDQVEVIIPHVDQAEIERIKSIISTAGFLEFRIVANANDHDYIIEAAMDEANLRATQVRDEDGKAIGLWAALGKEQEGPNKGIYRMSPAGTIFRNHETGELISDANENIREKFLPSDAKERGELSKRLYGAEDRERAAQEYFEGTLGIKQIDILVAMDEYNVRGKHVDMVSAGFDEHGFPAIHFTMTPDGAVLFQSLTSENAPDPQTGFKRQLAILMDNQLISAPQLRSMISKQGQITGRFTQQEVEDMVQIIRGGSLPAALSPEPTSESQISPLLGGVTIRQSSWALAISLGVILLFMAYYYRFAGLVACFALLSNLALILAVMILLKASFTLPGIAGLVLTVGMSVDANILIYERIREEIARGTKVRMALRNGFARATTTIVDSNVTTLITGIVLYVIGTDLIRGFAVTLILGILMSMFTAVYCSRVIFDLGERRHWFRDLHMVEWVRTPRFDFLGKRKIAIGASGALIVLGLVGAVARGVDLFDIDLAGGSAVDVLLTQSQTETQLREKLAKDQFLTVYHQLVEEERSALNPADADDAAQIADLEEELKTSDFDMTLLGLPGYTDDEGQPLPAGQAWKIVTSIPSVEHLELAIQRLLTENGRSLLVMRELEEFTPPVALGGATSEPEAEAPSKPPPAGGETSQPATDDSAASRKKSSPPSAAPKASEPQSTAPGDPRSATPRPPAVPEGNQNGAARLDLPGPNLLAMAGDGDLLLLAQADNAAQPADVDDAGAQDAPAEKEGSGKAAAPKQEAASSGGRGVHSKSELTFRYGIDEDGLVFAVHSAARKAGVDLAQGDIKVTESDTRRKKWEIELPLSPDRAAVVLERLKSDLANTPLFPSASKIGSKVAADMQEKAVMAILLSLLGIVIYLWIRFQRVAYGLAAVIAVVHDVLITLGVVALSYWLAGALGFLLVENFKISLAVIAAFLTIIGYSLNDTIVTFDRIREIRGKSPHININMVNDSVNQTLSRTLLTAGTTLVTVLVLYSVGGQGIRGFAFAMLVGVAVGTYSSVYIASPVLLWLTEGGKKTPPTKPAGEKLGAAPAERR